MNFGSPLLRSRYYAWFCLVYFTTSFIESFIVGRYGTPPSIIDYCSVYFLTPTISINRVLKID